MPEMTMILLWTLVCWNLWTPVFGDEIPMDPRQYDVFDRLLRTMKRRNYNRRVRPDFGSKPVEVQIFLYVGSLRSVSETTMDYKLELYFREYWNDNRLEFIPQQFNNLSELSLHESLAHLLWIPDTFLPNAIQSRNPDPGSITHRSLLRLQSTGHVLLSRRLSVTAECPMDLTMYPFDRQLCRLSIESYGYSIEDIVYRWREKDPVTLNNHLQLPAFTLTKVITKDRNITTATGTYSRLECCFYFERSAGFYFVQLFIPATAIVITAWLSLCMEKESTFSDMVEVILATTFLYYSYNTVMPKVSYIKAMDVFMGFCFVFVFAGLIKLAIIKHLKDKTNLSLNNPEGLVNGNLADFRVPSAPGSPEPTRLLSVPTSSPAKRPAPPSGDVPQQTQKNLARGRCNRLLYTYCRNGVIIMYPLLFMTFCTVFFVTYLRDNHLEDGDATCLDSD